MRQYLLGFLAGNLILGAGLLILLGSGAFNVSATVSPGWVERTVASWARDASIRRRAPAASNPFAGLAAAVKAGMVHYRESCLMCHGAPGVEAAELAEGLNPPAPELDAPGTQGRTDGELFWVVRNGVRLTGMPAFGPTHTDEELWQMVAFLRHLPQLSEEEREELRSGAGSDHHSGEGAPRSAEGAEAGEEPGGVPPADHHHRDGHGRSLPP